MVEGGARLADPVASALYTIIASDRLLVARLRARGLLFDFDDGPLFVKATLPYLRARDEAIAAAREAAASVFDTAAPDPARWRFEPETLMQWVITQPGCSSAETISLETHKTRGVFKKMPTGERRIVGELPGWPLRRGSHTVSGSSGGGVVSDPGYRYDWTDYAHADGTVSRGVKADNGRPSALAEETRGSQLDSRDIPGIAELVGITLPDWGGPMPPPTEPQWDRRGRRVIVSRRRPSESEWENLLPSEYWRVP